MTKPTSGCAPSEDSDQPGHPPSLIRVFTVHMKKPWVLSYPLSVQRRLWLDWADAQADLSLRWAHTCFVGFIMSQLTLNTWKINTHNLPGGSHERIWSDIFSPHTRFTTQEFASLLWFWWKKKTKSFCIKIWIHLSLVTRKPVFGVCDQLRLKPACSATETS